MDSNTAVNQPFNISNFLAKGLGAFWIFDALLQLQPKMFGPDFVSNILAPTLANQPKFISDLLSLGIKLYSINISVANIVVIIIQAGIGILLFFPGNPKKFRAGLYASIIWGLIVWIFGEGLGGLFTGTASFYTGAPGAVLVYVLISAFLFWPEKVTAKFLSKAAGIFFVILAALQFQPTFWSADGLQSLVEGASGDAINFISAPATFVADLLARRPVTVNIILIVIPLLLGLWLILKPNRTVAILTLIFLFLVWWLGQDFGTLTTLITGTATDPNLAPLLALLIFPLFALPQTKNPPL